MLFDGTRSCAEVYPRASKRSEEQWNALLTSSLAEEVARRYRNRRDNRGKQPKKALDLANATVSHTQVR